MPYDSEGNFTRDYNWDEDRQNDIDIASDRMDGEFDNYANGMNLAFLRDGRATMTGELKAGNFKLTQVANGTVPSDAVNKGQLDAVKKEARADLVKLVNMLSKVGDVKTSVKDRNHDNWFLCNGQAINRVTYSALFAIIGTRFGVGDGTTTFNLPDYRGKFIRGLGGDSESDIYKTQAEGLPNITGSAKGGFIGATVAGALKSDGSVYLASGGGAYFNNSNLYLDAKDSSAVYGASEHVTPINQALNFFIKVAEEK